MYFDNVLIFLFGIIVLLNSYTYRYDSKRLEYDLDYCIPKPSKFLIFILGVLIVIFYFLCGLFLVNIFKIM